ncbi:MAG TPA: MFS transporter [Solirubrobacterales bacterium]|jgi:predicted MFS family arabinose efflux permease|nr:MFS transporter [Solirubrobacterales bacterium]
MDADRSLLRDRDFRLVAGSVGLSALGDWVAIVALGLHVKEITDSGYAVAGLWICLFGPSVAVAGHAGLLVDRIEATRLLAVVSAAGAVIAGVLAFVDATAAVLALTALLGIVFAVSSPAEFALVPPLAGERRIQQANGHMETARYIGFGIGPLAGGLLFSIGDLELAMLVDAATFAAVACAALALRIRRDPSALEDSERAPRARDGIAYLFRDRVLSLAMAVAFFSLLFMSAVWVGELFFVADVLGKGDVAYGAWLSIWTLGMAMGALLLSPRVAAGAVAATGLAAVAVQGSGLALPALWLSFGFFLACGFMGGMAHGLKNVMFRSLIHVRVPERLHGRSFAAYNGIRNTAELGAFAAGGVLVALIGARGTLAYAGGLSALAGLIGLLFLLRMNRGWQPTGPVGRPTDAFAAEDGPGPVPAARAAEASDGG